MKFIADVNITQTVIRFLRESGHDVLDIKKANPQTPDTEIVKIAKAESRIVLTHDKDFLTLVQFPKYKIGTIALRFKIQNALLFCERLDDLLKQQDKNVLSNSLTILTEDDIEIYPYKEVE